MKIALDAMGGDFGPRVNVEGALLAAREQGLSVVLVGDQEKIQKELHRTRSSESHLLESLKEELESISAV
ncbi:MAG: hypothetical protein HYY61_02605 [Deltaproteobacteria bacterium]|nr:hypothetical protein [Deltaproteobacteria bacterium]